MLKDSEANSVQVNAFCAIDEFTTAYVHDFEMLIVCPSPNLQALKTFWNIFYNASYQRYTEYVSRFRRYKFIKKYRQDIENLRCMRFIVDWTDPPQIKDMILTLNAIYVSGS